MKNLKIILVLAVLMLAMVLRFKDLELNPAGVHVDEASIGYNAWSLLKTGKDEYGMSWPKLIKSFGDYKAPVYTYLLIPVYSIWGMSTETTRAVSAVAGVAAVGLLFGLVNTISGNFRWSWLSALTLAISPWHLMFSRSVIEANIALTLLLLSLWSFFLYLKGGKGWVFVAAAVGILSFWAYHSERVVIPLIYLGLGWNYRKKLFSKENWKWSMGGVILGVMMLAPLFGVITSKAFLARATGINILKLGADKLWGYESERRGAAVLLNDICLLMIREWLSLATAYFSPRYLFGLGDSVTRNTFPDLGPQFLWQLPFLLLGLIALVGKGNKDIKIIVGWLAIASIVPASMVGEPFGSIRSLSLVVPVSVVIALGIEIVLAKHRILGKLMLAGLTVWSIGKIYFSVFKINNYYRYQYWGYGVEQAISEINKLPETRVVFDRSSGEVYSQVLFFTKYDPADYQRNNAVGEEGYYNNPGRSGDKFLGRMTVKNIKWGDDIFVDQLLVGNLAAIGDEQIREHCLTEVFKIKGPEGNLLYRGVRTNPEMKEKYNRWAKLQRQLGKSELDISRDCWAIAKDN